MSSYAHSSSSSGSSYAQPGTTSGSPYAGGSGQPGKKKHGRGLFGSIGHYVASKTELAATDLKNIPGGLVQVGKSVIEPEKVTYNLIVHGHKSAQRESQKAQKQFATLAKGQYDVTKQTVQHPLRDPFQTGLLGAAVLSGGASVAGRVGEVGRVASEGGTVGDLAKAAVRKPPMRARLLRKNGEATPLQASRNSGFRSVQGFHDRVVQHQIDRNPEGRIASYGTKRIGGSQDETGRYQARMRAVPAAVLERSAARLSGKLPGHFRSRVEQAALELTSVNTAPEEAAAYHLAQAEKQTARIHELSAKQTLTPGEAKDLAAAKRAEPRNRALTKLYGKVADRGLLTKNHAGDTIVNAADHPQLAHTDIALAKVQGRGDQILTRYGIRTPDQLQEAVDKPARYRAGGVYEKPTPGKAGKSPALDAAQNKVARLQKVFDALGDRPTVQEVPRVRSVQEAQARLAALEKEHNAALDKIAAATAGPIDRAEVARRNVNNAAARRQQSGMTRSGRPSGASAAKRRLLPTVTAERRAAAERLAQDAIKRNPAHPTLQRWQQRTAEIDQLRAALNPDIGQKVDPAALGHETTVRIVAHPKRERVGGALSVAKDDVERQQRRVFGYHDNKGQWHPGTVKPTGVVGGETARPGRGFVSYRGEETKAPKTPAAASPGPIVGETPPPVSSHVNTGANIAHGNVPADITGMAARHYQQIVRFQNTSERRAAAIRSGSAVKQTSRDVLVRIPGVAHEKISPVVNEILGKSKLTADDLAGLHSALEAYREELVPGLREKFARDRQQPIGTTAHDAADAVGYPAPEGHVWVDRNILGELAKPARGGTGKIARATNNVNSAVTAATVYFKLGHIGTRVLTDAATNIIQGSATPFQISKAWELWHALPEEDRMRALAAAGQHGYEAMPHEGTSAASRVAGVGARWWAQHIDAPFRFNSLAFEARKAGFDTPAKFRQMLAQAEDPAATGLNAAQRAKVDWVLKRANREQIAYDRLSPFERQFITRAVWFYPWLRGTANFAVNTMLEHPFKAEIGGELAVQGEQQQTKTLGDLPSYERGLISLGGGSHPLVTDMSTFSPFATPADLLDVASVGQASSFLNPVYGAGLQLGTRQDAFGRHTNTPVTSALSALFAPTPEAQILAAYLHRKQPHNKRMFHTTPLSALARAAAGPAVPRHVNVAAAHSAAARERSGR